MLRAVFVLVVATIVLVIMPGMTDLDALHTVLQRGLKQAVTAKPARRWVCHRCGLDGCGCHGGVRFVPAESFTRTTVREAASREHLHYRNTYSCGCVEQCRCRGDKPEKQLNSSCSDCRSKELAKAAAESRKPSIAVDLDGTLAEETESFDPKVIGKPRPGARKWMREFRDAGVVIIVHTVRGDDAVTKAWLDKHEIPYDYINENPDQPPGSSDKLYADVYVDNRSIRASGPWAQFGPQVLRQVHRKQAAMSNQPLMQLWDALGVSISDNGE